MANILRTIQKNEKQSWVDLLFKRGPHEGDWVPHYPHSFRFLSNSRKMSMVVSYTSCTNPKCLVTVE